MSLGPPSAIARQSFVLASLLFSLVALLASGLKRARADSTQTIVAEGTYLYGGSSSDSTQENWVLSKTAGGQFIAEGSLTHTEPRGELLNYRVEMDQSLRLLRVESRTSMDYPSYTCKLGAKTIQCAISFEEPNPSSSGTQNAQMQPPFDLFGMHSYGWNVTSIVRRLKPGRRQTTVHLFLPNEDRYPDAAAHVQREAPESITIADKTFKAEKYTVNLVMDAQESSTFTAWTSPSGLCLRIQVTEGSPAATLPVIELVRLKQPGPEPFVPEMK